MQRTDAPAEIYGVDIQPEAIAQMQQGIAKSTQIHSVLHPVCADLKTLWDGAPLGQLDLVTCNPPIRHGRPESKARSPHRKLPGTKFYATSTTSAALPKNC